MDGGAHVGGGKGGKEGRREAAGRDAGKEGMACFGFLSAGFRVKG